MTADLESFGERVYVLRLANGLTQSDLAGKVGLSRSSITNLEVGRQGNIPLSRILALATALNTTVSVLVGETPVALPRVALSVTVNCDMCGEVGSGSLAVAETLRADHLRGHLSQDGGHE